MEPILLIRKLNEMDWETLVSWWKSWKGWTAPTKDSLPDDGTGGFILIKNSKPICACFLYVSNSKTCHLEWLISDPEYREDDRKELIQRLILGVEQVAKTAGKKYIFTIGRNKSLIETHRKLGYHIDTGTSVEMIKILE